jgi:adenine-specific DNA-methyltransferase
VKSKGVSICHVNNNAFILTPPDILFEHTSAIKNHNTSDNKWTPGLLNKTQHALLNEIRDRDNVHVMSDIAHVGTSLVTGANNFFLVTLETVEKFKLQGHVYPMFGKGNHCKGVVFDSKQFNRNIAENRPCFLVYLDKQAGMYTSDVQQYIRLGESNKLHERYKCRIRSPWHQVPTIGTTDIAMWRRSDNAPRLVYNEIKAHITDTAFKVATKPQFNAQNLVYNFINPLTALSAELAGRYYGGGVLEVNPSEVRNLIVPMPINKVDLNSLNELVKTQNTMAIMETHGANVLRHTGISETDIGHLIDSWDMLKNRRKRM